MKNVGNDEEERSGLREGLTFSTRNQFTIDPTLSDKSFRSLHLNPTAQPIINRLPSCFLIVFSAEETAPTVFPALA